MSHVRPNTGPQCDGPLTLEPAIDRYGRLPHFLRTFLAALSAGDYAHKSRRIGGNFVGQGGL